jgi:UDP-N-acetylmuramyl pentapeptide phosphotransferase/UDP-N-acetylglucosamine-1-phosphate transferase
MEFVLNSNQFLVPLWLVILLAVSIPFIITYISIPTILTVSHKLGLYETLNGRTSHEGKVPSLGGVAIFAAMVITGSLLASQSSVYRYQYILGAMAILFFIGLKDDLLVLDPRKKLFAQLLAVGIVVVLGNLRITTFHGFANIHEVPYLVSVLFTMFVFVVIINGFNLIDGIDGLAAGVAVVVTLTFGIWFAVTGHLEYALVPFGLAASMIAFLRFNVFSRTKKIFLGDTGSLCIGLIVAVVAVKYLELAPATSGNVASTAPAMAFGILIIPLFDTLRVFSLRILEGGSPFSADRKHIHHNLLDLGFSHITATSIIIGVNLLMIGLVFLLQGIGNIKLLAVLLVLASGLSYITANTLHRRRLKHVPFQQMQVTHILKRRAAS